MNTPSGITTVVKNAAGEVLTSMSNGKTVSFTYEASGKTKTALPQDGIALEMEYDLQGNRIELKDPDAGTIWTKYNGFGEIVWEKQIVHSEDSVKTSYTYHDNGLIQKIGRPTDTITHVYDSQNRLMQVAIPSKHSLFYIYDDMDRVISTTEMVDGTDYLTTNEYDELGNLVKETYPSSYAVENVYNKYGYLTKVNDNNGNPLWEAKEANAKGQLTKTNYGNNKEKNYGYSDKGQVISITSLNVIDQEYKYYTDGNLEHRIDGLTYQKEVFVYDTLNRLQSWSLYKNDTKQEDNLMTYDNKGNITGKSDVGYELKYQHALKPHAVTSISGKPDQVPSTDLDITYTDFKKIKTLKDGNTMLEVFYGMDTERRKSVFSIDSSMVQSFVFLGNYEIESDSSGNLRKLHYISGGDGLAAIHIIEMDSTYTIFPHTDYLGSLISYSDADGNVLEQHSYGPWGKRRNPTDWQVDDTRSSWLMSRGFTGHEHLDKFGLINMNGRVYDPLTASFLSPDPQMQSPENWLNYNRYSYGFNNPMSYTDPSGEIAWLASAGLLKAALWGAGISAVMHTASVALSDGGFSNWSFSGLLKSTVSGAISGMVTAGIGEKFGAIGNFNKEFGRALAHAGSQAIISGAMGENMLTSFASAGLGSLAGSGFMSKFGTKPGSMIAFSAISGGVGAELTGGDFFKGAALGTMTALLNHLGDHEENKVESESETQTNNNNQSKTYSYKGEDGLSATDLYLKILIDKAAAQFGIKDIVAFGAVVSGAPILSTGGKFYGATPGTSIASKYLSKIPGTSPVALPSITGYPKAIGGKGMRIMMTKTIGRFAGRAIPIVGWGILAYDVGRTFYNTQIEFNRITRGH